MDGLPLSIPLHVTPAIQQTLKSPIDCVGIGLHSGRRVQLRLLPAPVGSGVVFRRADLGVAIPARYDHVVDTRLCTVLGTVEHLLAALVGAGVHNAVVELDGPEVPIHDGSSASALFLIDCAGTARQDAFAPCIEVLRPVRVEQGEAFAELRPFPFAFDMAMSIDFEAAAIGRQALTLRLTPDSFRADLARARTFTLASEVSQMRAAGLALGGSLENAVVVDGSRVLNPAGLRMADEFVRHKLLDAVGDFALAGASLRARFVGHRTGHALNNALMRALFADDANWRLQQAADALPRGVPGTAWTTERIKAVA
jgi:UDP-3-O-[3-hydroxymyristoyl] N-acetylglucosamine deacetylase